VDGALGRSSHITYCVGAMELKRSDLQQMSDCWNDAFRRDFHCESNESGKILQVNFGTMDFKHLYGLYRWKFLTAVVTKYAYCLPLVEVLDLHHELVFLAEKYNVYQKCSMVNSIYQHCAELC